MWKQFDLLYKKAAEQNRGGKSGTMCAKLDELKGMSAEDILEKSEQQEEVPVDLDKIIETLGLYKEARDFSDIEESEKRGKISGLVVLMGDDVKILYNSNDDLEDKRFTAAHEIGHCCLHGDRLNDAYIEFLNRNVLGKKYEREASIFAARMLVPKKSLKMVYGRLIKPAIDDLARIFQVSSNVMKNRLKEEGLKV